MTMVLPNVVRIETWCREEAALRAFQEGNTMKTTQVTCCTVKRS